MTDIVDKQQAQIAKFVKWVDELLIKIEEVSEERRHAVAALSEQVDTARAEIDRKNLTIQALTEERDEVVRMANKLTAERDDARQRMNSILTEIDCRIEHGAESNGHLEAIRSLFKENTNEYPTT